MKEYVHADVTQYVVSEPKQGEEGISVGWEGEAWHREHQHLRGEEGLEGWDGTGLEPKQSEKIHIGVVWQEILKAKQVKEHPCLGAPSHEVPESKLGEDSFNMG